MEDSSPEHESLPDPSPEPVSDQRTPFDAAAETRAHQPSSGPSDQEREAESTAAPHEKPGRATGPRTLAGKAKSALNRLTHGCRSEKAVLPDEDPAEYQATVQDWFHQYDPHHHDEITLVEETALAHWHFQRASRRLQQIESRLPGNAWNWTDEHQQLYSNFTRYKTTAERSLIRWYKELEAYGGRELRFEQARENLRAKTASVELAWFKHREATLMEDLKVQQLVQVEKKNGRCITSYYPPNQQILDELAARPGKPLLVQRAIEFLHGVPPEYSWANPDVMQRNASCAAVQRFFYPDWLKAIEREKSTGHAGAIGILQPDSHLESQP